MWVHSFFLALNLSALGAEVPPSLNESVVMVVANPGCTIHNQGSGVVVAPGVVVTSAHVVQGSREVQVRKNEKAYFASAFILAPELDLCLIRIPALPFPPADLETEPIPFLGQKVLTVGFPGGIGPSITAGSITERWRFRGSHLLQSNASTHRGSSGGGLFNESGRLVGITTFSLLNQNDLTFSVPSAWIQHLLQRPWITDPGILACRPREILLQEFLDRMTEDPSNRGPWEAFSRGWVATRPEDPDAWYSLGHVLFLRITDGTALSGREPDPTLAEAAKKAYLKAVELNPGHVRAWNNLGTVHDAQGQDESAATAFRMAVRLADDYGLAWANLGASLLNLRRYDQAADAFRRGVRLMPDDARSWARLAHCEAQLGRWDPAIRHLRVALGLRPMCQEWWLDLSQLCQRAGKPAEFDRAFAFIRDRLPTFSEEISLQLRARQGKSHL